MALTPRYGLNYFGGNSPGSLTDDGAKYTGADRLALDRMLYALATSSRHAGPGTDLGEPSQPTATVTTGGGLPGGVTLSYCVTLVDLDGLESMPSPEITISTPDLLTEPDPPDLDEVTGGLLQPGLYYYALTGIRGAEESVQGTQVSITLIDTDFSSIELTLPTMPAGTETIQVWRMGAEDVGWTRIVQLPAGTTTYTDTGSVPANVNADDPSQQPPATNFGASIYTVDITLNDLDQPAATGGALSAWRIYRTESPGAYPSASLVANVVDRDDPGDTGDPDLPLVVAYPDEGDVLLDGVPPLASHAMRLAPYALDTAAGLPDPAGYPVGYPLIVDGQLYAQIGGAWTQLTVPDDPTIAEVDPLPDPASYATGYPLMWLGRLYIQVAGAWQLIGPTSFVTSTKFGVD